MDSSLVENSDLIIINKKTYKFDISVHSEKNIELKVEDIDKNKVFTCNYSFNSLKSSSPLFFNKNSITEIYEKMLSKIQSGQVDLEENEENIVFYLKFTLDKETFKSPLKLKLGRKESHRHSHHKKEKLYFKKATKEDVPLILSMIKELADYENLLQEVQATEELLIDSMFGEKSYAECIISYLDDQATGFAVFFHHFSTWTGKPDLWLDDLYVKSEFRKRGIGKALLSQLGKIAIERGSPRLQWWVLNWNEPSICFYKSIGAVPMDEWTVYRLEGEHLNKLANNK